MKLACFKGIAIVQLVFASVGKCLFDYEFLLCYGSYECGHHIKGFV